MPQDELSLDFIEFYPQQGDVVAEGSSERQGEGEPHEVSSAGDQEVDMGWFDQEGGEEEEEEELEDAEGRRRRLLLVLLIEPAVCMAHEVAHDVAALRGGSCNV